jgi:hypothetical protein
MSSLKVNQIKAKLRKMFEAHLDLQDVSATDKERDQKILSRCLAALAIYSQTGCTPKEAAEAVWDGSDDNGIDGAYFDQSDSRVIFVQSKWINKGIGEPEAKEIGTFVKGVGDAIEDDQANFHPRLQARLSDICLRLQTPGTSVHLVLASTGATSLAKPGRSTIDGFLQDLNGEDPEEIASAQVMGLSEVYACLANDPFQGNLSIEATILEWSYVATPYSAYFGMVDGVESARKGPSCFKYPTFFGRDRSEQRNTANRVESAGKILVFQQWNYTCCGRGIEGSGGRGLTIRRSIFVSGSFDSEWRPNGQFLG